LGRLILVAQIVTLFLRHQIHSLSNVEVLYQVHLGF
jgi:hypothetical protein